MQVRIEIHITADVASPLTSRDVEQAIRDIFYSQSPTVLELYADGVDVKDVSVAAHIQD